MQRGMQRCAPAWRRHHAWWRRPSSSTRRRAAVVQRRRRATQVTCGRHRCAAAEQLVRQAAFACWEAAADAAAVGRWFSGPKTAAARCPQTPTREAGPACLPAASPSRPQLGHQGAGSAAGYAAPMMLAHKASPRLLHGTPRCCLLARHTARCPGRGARAPPNQLPRPCSCCTPGGGPPMPRGGKSR